MFKRIFTFVVISTLFLAFCTKEKIASPINLQNNYFPLKVGAVIIYEVDSTAYSNFTNASVNYKFDLKDSITNTFDDLAGNTNYRIERFKKPINTTLWVYQKNFTRNKGLRAGEEFINNQRFVRIIFPPLKGSSWNGNSKNTLGEQEYLIEEASTALTINTLNFDSTIVVKEIDEINLIREDLVKSTYARNVGLIKKEVKAIDKNISTGKTTNGFVYTLKVKSFK